MDLEHFPAEPAAVSVPAALGRDGAVIVDDVLDASTLDVLRRELEPCLAVTAPGPEAFTGLNTRRFGALIERAPSTRALVTHPLILDITGRLLPGATAVQLHLTQAICIGPNSPAQLIHRDQWAFDFFEFPMDYEVQCNTIWAISDFTEANGATRVVPGSHLAADKLHLTEADTVPAKMAKGSLLFYTGALYHGGGPNHSADARPGTNITYNFSSLRRCDNQHLSVPS